jgi:hypothetical protein
VFRSANVRPHPLAERDWGPAQPNRLEPEPRPRRQSGLQPLRRWRGRNGRVCGSVCVDKGQSALLVAGSPAERRAGASVVPVPISAACPSNRLGTAACPECVAARCRERTCPSLTSRGAALALDRTPSPSRAIVRAADPSTVPDRVVRARCRRARPRPHPRRGGPGAGQSAPIAGDRAEHRAGADVVRAAMPGACPSRQYPSGVGPGAATPAIAAAMALAHAP